MRIFTKAFYMVCWAVFGGLLLYWIGDGKAVMLFAVAVLLCVTQSFITKMDTYNEIGQEISEISNATIKTLDAQNAKIEELQAHCEECENNPGNILGYLSGQT